MIPYLTGQVKESPRTSLMYFSDDGDVIAVRVGDYKFNLAVQRANTMRQWAEPFVKLRLPYIMSLRRDPFERAEYNSNTYLDWMVDHVPQMYAMQAVVAGAIGDFAKFPPRQKPASFNLDAVLAQVTAAQLAIVILSVGAQRRSRRTATKHGQPNEKSLSYRVITSPVWKALFITRSYTGDSADWHCTFYRHQR